eukprot:CAMPEP_0178431208 /NCGR_PEP_ID=MMETSP0689_2-20121128/31723_1 /TAXON_ID=160604 /ORGANISM="Amphidinium massartii, Strain CS-259" /LENGTH=190 /DNA_ID=CAMNT_0020053101 /DNA_START=71 /DNA_END=643 /DNA_ORIENTATION=+
MKMLGSGGMAMLLYQVDLDKMGLVMPLRILFFIAQLSCIGMLAYIYMKVANATDLDGIVHVPAVVQFGQEVQPSQSMSVKEYDLQKCKHQASQILIGSGVCYFVHHKFGYVVPLAMQIVMLPLGTLEAQVSQVHLFGRPAKGNLKRPWAQPSPFGVLQEVRKEAKKKVNDAKKANSATSGKSAANKKKGK